MIWGKFLHRFKKLASQILKNKRSPTNSTGNFDWITENIAVGGAQDQTDPHLILARGIEAILNCSINYDTHHVFLKAYKKIPTYNGEAFEPKQIQEGIQFIQDQIEKGRKLLIACNAGTNRSVAMLICWFCGTKGMRVKDALALIQEIHPCNPDPRKLVAIQEYFDQS